MRETEIIVNDEAIPVLITDDCHESTADVLHEIKMIAMLGVFNKNKGEINNDTNNI